MPVKRKPYFRQRESIKCQKMVLNSGITVCWEHLSHIRSCSVAVAVNTGGRDETKESWGYSHFIEHMLFKGTSKRGAYEIASALEKKGGYLNAMTGNENTWIEARCLDYQLPEVIELIGDMLSNSKFTRNSIENEKEVVRQEIKNSFDSPEEVVFDRFFKDVFAGHQLGKTILGDYKSVKNITRKKLLDHFFRHYTFQNTFVGVVGNISVDILPIIQDNFIFQTKYSPLRRQIINTYSGEKFYIKKGIEQINFVMGGIAPNVVSDERFSFQILMNLLGGGLSSRLFQLLREKNPLVYNVYTFYYLYSDVGVGGIYFSVTQDNIFKVEKLIQSELKKICDGGITEQELEFSKDQILGNIILGLESSKARVNKILNDHIYREKLLSLDKIEKAVSSVKLDDLNRVARDFFSEDNIMRTYLTPKAR